MIKALLDLLKPAPTLPEITDPEVVRKSYRYWRTRIFSSMYIGYCFYYFTRKSFTFITPVLSADLGFTKDHLGLLVSILSLTYGISRFTSGILCDRSNPRYFMAIGLILTGICNLFCGFSSGFIVFAIFWGLNGWFQGWGWPACAKQLTFWFSRTERGTWWSIGTTSHTVGGFLIAYVAAYCAKWYGWRFGMFIPGILSISVGFWLLNRLRDVPRSLGLPCVEKFRGETIEENKKESAEVLSVKQILFQHVLNNKYVWILALSYFFVYLVRTAINDWGTLYLVEMKGYGSLGAAACVSWFEVGGFFGMLVAGWGSDYWFQGKRAPVIILTSVGLAFAIYGLWFVGSDEIILTSVVMALIGFLVFGPQMLVGLAAAEFVDKKAASTSNGFAGFCANLGAVVAGYPLLKIADLWGWYEFIVTLSACSLVIALILLPMWSVSSSTARQMALEPAEELPASIAVNRTVSHSS